ncbi:hypothetical protein GCM10011588_61800 [Nocardia jinanensis]|uniref:Uncharacterized protein n=1 Tax=Nocardia jinanensis TaxID=382504 RepID=A0A917VYK4_9NOCA|nr:hypothetical protein GCM10011588_61800 [Nocardia jinanensis]
MIPAGGPAGIRTRTPSTCPVSNEDREMAMVRNRFTMSLVTSVHTETAIRTIGSTVTGIVMLG